MNHKPLILVVIPILLGYALADDRWVWSNRNQRTRNFHNDNIDRLSSYETQHQLNRRNERTEREPTTKRPLPGSVQQHDEIDDYPDADAQTNVGTRQYPYASHGVPPSSGFNGFAQPGFGGNAANGILVGPSGPTGIIGRPPGQQNFGGGYQGNPYFGQPGFGGQQYPQQGYPGYAAQPGGYPIGQNGFNGQGFGQYPGGQYPTEGFHNSVGGGIPHQGAFPNQGGQYPGIQGGFQPQYPLGGHQYTEGYGLANNNGFSNNFLPNPSYNSLYGGYGGNAFDESSKAKFQIEGKSAESRTTDKSVDDKVNKKFNKKE